MTIRHDHPPGACPRYGCGADLRRAHPIHLPAGNRLLITQAWLDTIPTAVETNTTDHLSSPAAFRPPPG